MNRKLCKLLAFLLAFFLLAGCTPTPKPTEPPTLPPTQPPTEPPAPVPEEVYAKAITLLEGEAAVTMDVTQVLTSCFGGQTLVEESQQLLSYADRNTDSVKILQEETVLYKIQESSRESEDDDGNRLYREIYADGKLYVELEEEDINLVGELTAEEATQRFIPVVLLDATLYEALTLDQQQDQLTIHFTEATAAEAWAIPEEAEFLEASGYAVINAAGEAEKMSYTVRYRYGSVENTWQVETQLRQEALAVTVPENAQDYKTLSCVDALWAKIQSGLQIWNAGELKVSMVESTFSEAGGVVLREAVQLDWYDVEDTFMIKVESTQNLTTPKEHESSNREEIYRDGKYTVVVDDGIPATQMGIKEKDVRTACENLRIEYVPKSLFWEDVTVEDLGSIYLYSFTFTPELGDTMQSSVSQMFYGDVAFLNSYASKYETKEITGYMSLDKYTGMLLASGLYFEGAHTIDGDEYIVSMQIDQAVEMPSFGTYKSITEELLPEEEPDQKATPLFYHVTGENGEEMWLLGTIHVGDVRTGFLPQQIYDAFAASDALALEINQEAFEEQLKDDTSLQKKVSKAYYYSGGSTAEDYLSEETYALAKKYMKATGNYNDNTDYLKISMWENSIQNFYLSQGHQLYSELGVEERLIKLAKEQEKPIREVESSLFQIQMLTGWSKGLQKLMLEDMLECDAQELWEDTYELYELWCRGDEAELRKALSQEEDLAEMTEEERAEYEQNKKLYDEYDKAMNYDRNKGMLKTAVKYLKSGDVVFFAVGLAHLLDETNGLVDALRDAGYTVELVPYS